MSQPLTLQQYLLHQLEQHKDRLDLMMIMAEISTIGKLISQLTNRSGLTGLHGSAGTLNIHEESQAKLDVFANEICKDYLSESGLFAALASEEEKDIVDLHHSRSRYVICFDPIDGSSNIDVNLPIGTIFSVYRTLPHLSQIDVQQFLQPGRSQVLAGYVLYSASTMLVFSWGDGVHMFTLNSNIGEYQLVLEHATFPAEATYYSFNESYAPFISDSDQHYLHYVRNNTKKARYVGAFIADFHRILLKGGVVLYPATDINRRQKYIPKLRLVYEANPIAFLAEQAGGAATNGLDNLLDVKPTLLHQKSIAYIGNAKMVQQRANL